MSVTFYDRDNPSKWSEEDYQVIGGGPEANFSNSNAGWILKNLGFSMEDVGSLCGEVSAIELKERIARASAAIDFICTDPATQEYMKRSFSKLMEVVNYSNSQFGCGIICWN